MKNSSYQIKLRLVLLLPLLASMILVGFYNISNANQSNNLQLQSGLDGQLFPVMGYASLQLNGQALTGFMSQNELGGVDLSNDFIEFFTYRHELTTGGSAGSGRASTRIASSPIIMTKRIDQTTPLLAQGLVQNQVVEGFFLFFATDPNDGTLYEAFKVSILGGRVSSLRAFTVVGDFGSQIVEEAAFTYSTIRWEDIANSVEFEYDWNTGA